MEGTEATQTQKAEVTALERLANLEAELETELKKVPVPLKGHPGAYLLELGGLQRSKHQQRLIDEHMVETAKGDGTMTLKNFVGLHSLLLSFTLYKADGTLFSEAEIDALPNKTSELLYQASRELSCLDQGAKKAAAKN